MKKLMLCALTLLCALSASAGSYKVGDYYEKDGVKGIVIRVDASGDHGLIMSLSNCSKKWIDDTDEKFNTNCFYEDDGEKNMAVIEKYINENGKSWSMFPFFEWCRSLGSGWYAPAVDELKDIVKTINGDEGKINEKCLKNVEKTIKANKGDGLRQKIMGRTANPWNMLSSTEAENGFVNILMFEDAIVGKGKFKIKPWPKGTGGKMVSLGSRAVRKF